MKPVDRSEILPLAEYEKIREHFRARVIEEKKRRRGLLGDRMSFVFESHDTALLQIQEMLRTERITREGAIQHEIETYNELVPGDREVSATLLIEIDDKDTRDDFLTRAKGVERALAFTCDGERFPSVVSDARLLSDRASAVIYARFPLSDEATAKVAKGAARLALRVDHPAYEAEAVLSPATVRSLAEDFA